MTGPTKDPAHQALKTLRNIYSQLGYAQNKLAASETHNEVAPYVDIQRREIKGIIRELEGSL